MKIGQKKSRLYHNQEKHFRMIEDIKSLPIILNETWLPIPEYEGLYSVSDYGRVWSVKRRSLLKPTNNGWGYFVVSVYKEGKEQKPKVHRLVLLTFKPKENSELFEVNHINSIKTDNRLGNLEWLTPQQHKKLSRGVKISPKLDPYMVIQIRDLKAKHGISITRIANICGVGRRTVQKVLAGRTYKNVT